MLIQESDCARQGVRFHEHSRPYKFFVLLAQ
jgi:hypothetical protein